MSVQDLDNILYRLAVTEDARLEHVIGLLLPRLLAHVTAEATPTRPKVWALWASCTPGTRVCVVCMSCSVCVGPWGGHHTHQFTRPRAAPS